MKCGEPPLQGHVRLPRATDEPHGPRAGPVEAHGLLLCSLDRAVQCQTQIIIGVHAQEGAISMALEEIARPFATASSYDAGDHGFRTLEPPRSFKLLKALIEDRLEPDRRHVLLPTLPGGLRLAGWTQTCSMSLVIVPRLNSGDPIPVRAPRHSSGAVNSRRSSAAPVSGAHVTPSSTRGWRLSSKN